MAFGPGVIVILLTGYLDDGTDGLKVIKECGGITIVQDPQHPDYLDMPTNAINQVDVDHVIPIIEIGSLLYQLISRKIEKKSLYRRIF